MPTPLPPFFYHRNPPKIEPSRGREGVNGTYLLGARQMRMGILAGASISCCRAWCGAYWPSLPPSSCPVALASTLLLAGVVDLCILLHILLGNVQGSAMGRTQLITHPPRLCPVSERVYIFTSSALRPDTAFSPSSSRLFLLLPIASFSFKASRPSFTKACPRTLPRLLSFLIFASLVTHHTRLLRRDNHLNNTTLNATTAPSGSAKTPGFLKTIELLFRLRTHTPPTPPPTTEAMDFDWTHSFCLACDKQVSSTKDAYCSEACRLADFEKTSSPSSGASSPGLNHPTYPWTHKTNNSTSYFQPTYNSYQSYTTATTSSDQSSTRVLTPSSSHSSLCSMQSTSTTGDSTQLSAKTRQELRAYAVSFENVRMQRRRSY